MSLMTIYLETFLCFVVRTSQYNCLKKYQLDAELILCIFRQPLHVSGVSRLIIRSYNCMYTTIVTYCWNNPTRTTDGLLQRIISTSCCMHTVVPPDDEPRYARNM